MKRILSVLTLSLILFACKKDSDSNAEESGHFIKCKIDGSSKEFKAVPMALISDYGPSGIGLNLSANESVSGSLVGINLGINFTEGDLEVKTYKETDQTFDYTVAGVYNPGSMTIVYGAGMHAEPMSPLTITFTSISDKEISGTFQGSFYETNTATGDLSTTNHVMITEGTFKLPVKKL